MEIIEKQVEKVKEVPYGYGYYDGYGRNVVGKANAGLALGIVGTVLGGAALYGNVDIEGILSEMMDNLMTTQPFTIKTSFIGDVEIGGGNIKLNIPLTDKRLVFNMSDLENFKEMLITKD